MPNNVNRFALVEEHGEAVLVVGDDQGELLLRAAAPEGIPFKGAEWLGDEERPYTPPPGTKVEHGIQNIDDETNIQLLRREGVHRNAKTGQLEPRRIRRVSPSRIKHLPGQAAEEKRARVRLARKRAYVSSARENKRLLRNAGRLPRDQHGWYRDGAGNAIYGNLVNQYNENWDDVQVIAQEYDRNPGRFEDQNIDESDETPLAGSAADEFVNPHTTAAQGATQEEPNAHLDDKRRWEF